jgi:hypothetical protein
VREHESQKDLLLAVKRSSDRHLGFRGALMTGERG